MNRTYELMFIVRPDMPDEDLDKLISTLQSVVPPSGGNVVKSRKNGQAPSGVHRAAFPRWHLRADGD